MGRTWRAALVAAPALVLAGVGLSHPAELTERTAPWWTTLHVVLLPVFPLLAVSLWLVLRGAPGPLAWVARTAAYGYAAFYTGLDLLAGVGTGALVQRGTAADSAQVRALFAVGNDLGDIGVWCWLVATAAAGLTLARAAPGRGALGAVVLVGGAVLFSGGHVYWPQGVLAMLVTAAGFAVLAVAAPPPAATDVRHTW